MGLFSKSKKIRSTADAETLRKVFTEDEEVYKKVEASEDLKRFYELDAYVNSPAFKARRKQIEQLRYKDSEYYKKEKEYKDLLRAPKLRAYYLIKESQELQGYSKVRDSALYEEYAKLKVVVRSAGFDKKLRPEEFLAYKKIVQDPKIKAVIRLEKNKKFRYYSEVKDTPLPEKFEKLAAFIRSEDFKKNRTYLLDKKRYFTTDDYKLLCEYEGLKKRPDLVKYFALREDEHFNRMRHWTPVFSDDFMMGKLDENKWITRYYAGERFLNDTYAVGEDIQLFTRENISFGKNVMCLNFRKESIIGKYWDAVLGIREKKFEYTSAMISSACSFRQRYGRFEAKIRFSHSPVHECFWMRGDTDVPHIGIMESAGDSVKVGNSYVSRGKKETSVQVLKDIPLANDYYIFTFEWTRDRMTWMINDTVVREVRENIPDVPMYIGLSLCATREPSGKHVPSRMEVDWVRFYKQKEEELK